MCISFFSYVFRVLIPIDYIIIPGKIIHLPRNGFKSAEEVHVICNFTKKF